MKNKITKLSLALLMITGIAYGQDQPMSDKVRQATNVEFLQQFAKEKAVAFEINYNKAVGIARAQGMPLSGEEDGRAFGLVGYDEETGSLIYNTTYNNVTNGSSLQTANAKPLHADGIEGAGMIVGVWDGGAGLPNHMAFSGGRYVLKNSPNSGSNANGRSHAAHVAGTVAGGDFGSGTAMGFAYEATVHAYNGINKNDKGPMAAAAASQTEPIYVSNHSYGLDYEKYSGGPGIFGRYEGSARAYDEIANNAPYYTIVFAAGNDRGKGYNTTRQYGKDLLSQGGVSKNTVVVAATEGTENFSGITGSSSVVGSNAFISSFSNYGPTDDYRIKPDIAAKGVSVTSVGNSSIVSTSVKSGTSMAAPAVTGVFTLWQSYHKSVFGEYMKSASVRALMAHTARETGPAAGPDFMFGWGLIDADKGRQIMDQAYDSIAFFKELNLPQETTFEYEFAYDGVGSLVATIAWNDPAGTVTSQSNLNVKKLVNDLDMRLINVDTQTEYYPWSLVHNFALPPTSTLIAVRNVDNQRDNIEKIEPTNAIAGNYKVLVSHKGTLSGGAQDFTLIVSGGGGKMPTEGTLGMEEQALKSLKIYPNPTSDILYLSGEEEVLRDSDIVVYDMNGKKILETVFSQNHSGINVSSLESGVYILSVSKNNAKQSYKFIKK